MSNPFNALTTQFTGSIDRSNDSVPFWQSSTNESFWINQNTLLNLTSQPVGISDSQTLTSKTLTSPTISSPTLSGTLTGTYTLGGSPTFPSSIVTLTGSQTLTNKVLTSPAITGGSLDNSTVTVDSVSGHTTSNTGTIYGISVTAGTIGAGALGANSVTTASIATNAVTASKLATNAITLGYVQTTTSFSVTGTGSSQAVTPLTLTVTVPSGGRNIKITAFSPGISTSGGESTNTLEIWDGVVGSGTKLSGAIMVSTTAGYPWAVTPIAVVSPGAGSKTYNVAMVGGSSDTLTMTAAATSPAFLLVEAI